MSIKYANIYAPLQGPPKFYPNCDFWSKNIPSGSLYEEVYPLLCLILPSCFEATIFLAMFEHKTEGVATLQETF
jgi:hypothetical protein